MEAVELDITDPTNIHRVAPKLLAEHPDLNVLMNDAGTVVGAEGSFPAAAADSGSQPRNAFAAFVGDSGHHRSVASRLTASACPTRAGGHR